MLWKCGGVLGLQVCGLGLGLGGCCLVNITVTNQKLGQFYLVSWVYIVGLGQFDISVSASVLAGFS